MQQTASILRENIQRTTHATRLRLSRLALLQDQHVNHVQHVNHTQQVQLVPSQYESSLASVDSRSTDVTSTTGVRDLPSHNISAQQDTTDNQIQHIDPNNNNNFILNNEADTQLNFLDSVSSLLPYIWYMRHQLFVSFLFVLIIWIILQIIMYFVNLAFGSALNWVNLLTSELLDFIVFAGIMYVSVLTLQRN
jgi:preprotein translocase subunit SecE